MFMLKYPNVKCSYWLYIRIFQENFNLKFKQPQVDTCVQCEELTIKIKSKNSSDSDKQAAVVQKMVHVRRSKKFWETMRELKSNNNPEVGAITFDYMQNVYLPVVPIQDTFYRRQLTVSIFEIHCLKTGKGTFFVYHEGTGSKGANEVCSLLHSYIQENIPETVRLLHVFSDGCTGQNRNHTVSRFLLALVDSGRFQSVQHYFPIRGHTFLPNDRDFAVVKRLLQKHDRLYTLRQLAVVITHSTRDGRFQVVFPKREDFKNYNV